jgi:hypothetical protein
LGTKNRIFIALISHLVLHKLRNIFQSKELYITKAKLNKIKIKHNHESHFLYHGNFQRIIDNTIGICKYQYDSQIINFIAIVENEIFLYSIATGNFYIYLGTFFKTDKRKILKQCNYKIDFLNDEKRKKFERFV